MSDFLSINESNFEVEVLKSSTPILVEFGATWCAPCKMLEPVLEQYAQELGSKARLGKIDVDESAIIAETYQVMGVPTVILFKAGKPVERMSGYLPKNRLAAKFGTLIG
ncbi:MAG: thioredoxin [Anaerolineaceae bacterium]|nr:thioredoxin [Anaerolineaceae bacterium]